MKRLFVITVVSALLLAGCGNDAPSKEWYKSHIEEATKTAVKCDDANYWTKNAKRCANAKSALADEARGHASTYESSGNTTDFTPTVD